MRPSPETVSTGASLKPALAGATATFSGIGLARFAYVPLFPAMVSAGWVTGGEAGLLGALNLGGYLAGVLGGRSLAQRLGTAAALDAGMVLAALSFMACGWNGGVTWLAAWRGAAGVAGGVLMALAGPAVQGAVDPRRRGLAGGVVITGVGFGVIVGSLAVPSLLRMGLEATWLCLGVLVIALWLSARTAWPVTPVVANVAALPAGAAALCAAYGLSGAGLVPHMVYFSDLAVRGRGLDTAAGGYLWTLFGIGGLAGAATGGLVADRWGGASTIRIWLCLQVAALSTAFAPGVAALASSALLAGFSAVGLSAVALARAREIAGPNAGLVWVRATASFAVAQAVTGLALATLFAWTGSHLALFATGLALSAAALVPVLWPSRPAPP